uniref:Uncharacterized protein n=1 Tax=Anguilla anguilla TaxID=7936 RepID=A0A0E9WQC5_ANGAN
MQPANHCLFLLSKIYQQSYTVNLEDCTTFAAAIGRQQAPDWPCIEKVLLKDVLTSIQREHFNSVLFDQRSNDYFKTNHIKIIEMRNPVQNQSLSL